MIIVIFILALTFLAVNFFVASKFHEISIQKGYDDSVHSLVMCFFLGIIGYLYVIALPDLNARRIIGNSTVSKSMITNDSDVQRNKVDTDICNETNEEKLYNSLVAKAEKFKDTFYVRDYRIRTYESIVKNMEILAKINYKDSAEKLQEYANHLELLKAKKIK